MESIGSWVVPIRKGFLIGVDMGKQRHCLCEGVRIHHFLDGVLFGGLGLDLEASVSCLVFLYRVLKTTREYLLATWACGAERFKPLLLGEQVKQYWGVL